MNCPAMPPGGGRGMKFRKPFKPNTRKITPARYRAIAEAVFISWFSFSIGSHYMAPIILISIQLMTYTSRRAQVFHGPRHSRARARLACHDEGDASADKVPFKPNTRKITPASQSGVSASFGIAVISQTIER